MKTIEELKKRKKELHYTNLMISLESGVPLGTVQKIFSGATPNPRYDTMMAITRVLDPLLPYEKKKSLEDVAQVWGNRVYSLDDEETAYNYEAQTSSQVQETALKWAEKTCGDDAVPRWPNQGSYTVEDYFNLPEDSRVELIDGVFYELNAPDKIHQGILLDLAMAFSHCIEEHAGECSVFIAPLAVRLDRDNRTMLQPDLLILCHEDNNIKFVDGAPEFVAEILSPSTRSRDCIYKLNKYILAGVQEYWIIDPLHEKIFTYVFEKDAAPTVYSFHDRIPVGISDGDCEIDFEKIYQRLEKRGLLEPQNQ